ncbi:MAG: hypothetical protein WDM91_06555 [Rhizomicrobium sp.]
MSMEADKRPVRSDTDEDVPAQSAAVETGSLEGPKAGSSSFLQWLHKKMQRLQKDDPEIYPLW